ncbi:hypothetical protein LMH87_001837 [Akanthomyces muscarius]|uniref:MAT1-1-2 n=1 Tax=Akanthomyces muscarius TaxID=2231603 RepID=A0A9W8Q762_AKAMU|nr:hypothetical protein LMH87_001837 [Akanthomyces muscarius]KAJ4147305.1 hypothetical protein LMH87_001837 [Akanthomyces muscarius]
MDSVFNFIPLWTQDECIADSKLAIDSIRSKVLRLCLERNRSREERSPCLGDVLHDVVYAIESLLWNPQDENDIIDRIVAFGAEQKTDPVLMVKEAIALWYISAVPISTRDPHQGLPPDAEIEVEAGATILRWNRQYAASKHEIANLGLMAMLTTSETWSRPESPSLQFGTLVANAATAILFGAFMIFPKIKISEPLSLLVSVLKDNEAMQLYLRTTWQLAREGASKYTNSPSAEFGATASEVKIDHAGRRLLCKVGQESWSEASVWHPCRKTPGSAWNKFMKNTQQPYFPLKKTRTALQYRLPSSCLSLAEPWEIYYSELRSKFDQAHRQRITLSNSERAAQFSKLADETCLPYPMKEHSENSAEAIVEMEQEYLYNVPMIKKNINDLRGNLSLPFITSTAQALRFESEPDEVEADLFLMTFSEGIPS